VRDSLWWRSGDIDGHFWYGAGAVRGYIWHPLRCFVHYRVSPCVCVSEKEKKRASERESEREAEKLCVQVCVCVCEIFVHKQVWNVCGDAHAKCVQV
jgi:hypothetical protein